MSACDVLCSKAGPGKIAKATTRGIPLLLTGFLPGQEEANLRYVVDKGAGVYAARSKKIAAIFSQWTAAIFVIRRDGSEMQCSRASSGIPRYLPGIFWKSVRRSE